MCPTGYPPRGVRVCARWLLALGAFSFPLPVAGAAGTPVPRRHGMVVAVSPPGAEVGRDVLLRGGNAVDAAVAVALSMAVTYPAAGNLGGGGFMVIHPPRGQGEPVVVDYRETAPAAASRTMFTKADSWYSH